MEEQGMRRKGRKISYSLVNLNFIRKMKLLVVIAPVPPIGYVISFWKIKNNNNETSTSLLLQCCRFKANLPNLLEHQGGRSENK